jgi:hypothetical protein
VKIGAICIKAVGVGFLTIMNSLVFLVVLYPFDVVKASLNPHEKLTTYFYKIVL